MTRIIKKKYTYLNISTCTEYSKSYNSYQIKNNLHKLPELVKGHIVLDYHDYDATEELISITKEMSKRLDIECVLMSDGTIYTSRDIEGCEDLINVDDIVYSSYD